MRLLLQCICPVLLLAQASAPALENEFVRVAIATDQPADEPGPAHEHKNNRVMIYLDSGDIRITNADGKVENQHWTPGDVAWSPAGGVHTSQNLSKRPIRIVEVELKSEGKADTATAPDRTRAVVDNPQVRVYRASAAPKTGRNYLAVDLKSATVLWDKMPEGKGPFVIAEVK